MSIVHRALLFLAAAITLVPAGCASTRITSEWQDPSFRDLAFRKVLAVFQNADPGLRRIAEDEMARDIPRSVAAYRVLGEADLRDLGPVKARVQALGFDSSVVMRVVGVEHPTTYAPSQLYAVPGYYHDFWGHWGYGWTTAYEPAELRNERVVRIATDVYGVPGDKLAWASESETFDPASLPAAIGEVVRATAKAAAKAMRERG
ncbi:MAG TPA: hypothetical protein VLY46_01185 [Usitatibacter sp.]|nr:hypothetical protein [Usitatibacter sp.]